MSLPLETLTLLQSAPAREAWRAILQHAWELCCDRLDRPQCVKTVLHRDRAVGDLDQLLATAAWDLWRDYDATVEKTADALADWWLGSGGRAVLILDALSLREVPWILMGAATRGYTVHQARATGCEIPGDTNAFARALGFGARAALENNGASSTHRLPGARTDTSDAPWRDCAVSHDPRLVYWHHWPDARLHELGAPGKGLEALTLEAAAQLSGDDFWSFVERLTQGRRLLITADHGYAASGHFADATDDQATHLKTIFGARRYTPEDGPVGAWVPPLDLALSTRVAPAGRYALGRRKWKVGGGYPTLTHGGLTVLEIATPFIEISRS
jgi:hypothetical protein